MNFIKKIAQSQLFKITSLNSLSVLIKIATGLITSKLLALFVGPSGMALVGNLRNFMTTLESVSTLGFQNGIVKYVAENDDNEKELSKIISTVFITIIAVTIGLSIGLFICTDYWNTQIFGVSYSYKFVIKAIAMALGRYAISIFFIYIIRGNH